MVSTILGFITKPLADIVGSYQARKTIAAQNAAVIAKARVDLKVTRIQAQIDREVINSRQDNDYDTQVLKNRNNTYADEFIILVWFALFILHFVPDYSVIMADGWAAMGYNGAPWWFEFGMVGILVSTLGLMRMFKLWAGKGKTAPKLKQVDKVNADKSI